MKGLKRFLVFGGFLFASFTVSDSVAGVLDGPLLVLTELERDFDDAELSELYRNGRFFELGNELEKKLYLEDMDDPVVRTRLMFSFAAALLRDGDCERSGPYLERLQASDLLTESDFFFLHVLFTQYHLCKKEMPAAISSIEEMGLLPADGPVQNYYKNFMRAQLFKRQGMYGDMVKALKEADRYTDDLPDNLYLISLYYELGFVHAELRNYDTSLDYLMRGLVLAESENNLYYLWKLLACTGICQVESGNYADGVKSLEKSEELSVLINQTQLCGNSAFLAKGLWMIGERERAMEEAHLAWHSVRDSDDLRDRRNVLHALYDIYRLSGDYERALEVSERWAANREALYEREYDRMIAEVEGLFQLREVEMRLAEHESMLQMEQAAAAKKKIWIWLGFSVSLILLALIFVISYHLRSRRRIASMLEEKNLELEKIDEAKTRFFEDLSHEFRTPLTLIQGHLEELEERTKSAVLKNSVKTALRNTNRLKELVSQILDLSQLRTGDFKINKKEILPHFWFSQCIDAFQSMARSKSIDLKVEMDNLEDLSLQLDQDKLEKVINNLLVNACKYSPEGGRVFCRVDFERTKEESDCRGRGKLMVEIEDEGPGIPEKVRGVIFDRGNRGVMSPSSNPGYGIGLALSRELTEAMGGELLLRDKNGSGSLFVLQLPCEYAISLRAEEVENISVKNISTTPLTRKLTYRENLPKVLIVENHIETARFLKSILSADFSVLMAGHGREALQVLKSRKVDLVLSDLQMPVLDGFDLLKDIRGHPTIYQNVPFVVLSGDVSDETRRKMLRSGADAFVAKPIVKDNLIVRIQSILNQMESRKKLGFWDKIHTDEGEDIKKLFQAEKVILERIDDNALKISEVAKELSVSNRTLERLFKKHHQLTPVKYVRNLRLKIAYHLLADGRCETVAEAREMTGFCSPSYFSRSFFKKHKIKPSQLLEREVV